MGKPGSGRYTDYVPANTNNSTVGVGAGSAGYERRFKLFNLKATNGKGLIYGPVASPENSVVIGNVGIYANKLIPPVGPQAGDTKMFGAGVDMNFGTAPDVSKVTFKSSADASTISISGEKPNEAGRPANPYMPNPISPGAAAGNTVNFTPSSDDPGIVGVITNPQSDYIAVGEAGGAVINTASPSATSTQIASLGQDLAMGSSKPK